MVIEKPKVWYATLWILTILFVTGCSATKDYEKTVGELQAALKSSIDTVSKIDVKITEEENTRWVEMISAGTHGLIVQEDTCEGGASACGLAVQKFGDPGNPNTIVLGEYPIESMLVKSQGALTALGRYLDTLHEIAKVDTAGKVAEQTNKALVSVGKIEAEIARINKTEVGTSVITKYSEPAGALFNWAVEAYVQNVKHDALATATKAAQDAIDSLNNLLSGVGDAVAERALKDAEDTFGDAKGAYDTAELSGSPTEADIKAFVKASRDNDQARKAKNARPLAAFTEAHRKLKQFLNNEGKVSLADAIASIKRLKEKADEFKTLIESFKEPTT